MLVIKCFQKLSNYKTKNMNLKHLKLAYHYFITHFLKLCLIPLMAFAVLEAFHMSSDDISQLWLDLHFNLVILFAIFGFTIFAMTRCRAVYIVDFACFRLPSPHCLTMTCNKFADHMTQIGIYNASSLEFQCKILERSDIGDETTAPRAILSYPPRSSMTAAREEAEDVIFNVLDNLFANNIDVKPFDVDILVVNCGTFSPPPSFSAMIVNKYKMRSNIKSFNLSGMGCSSGLIAIDLANNMLQVHKNSYAIVVTLENTTHNWYQGNNKKMLISNCLFRVGGAAVLLSNRNIDRRLAKYKLVRLVRTHMGADDTAYKCIYKEEDDEENTGVSISKDVVAMAGNAIRRNIITLGPLVLPLSELVLFAAMFVAKKLFNPNMKSYIPDFKLAFEHFCIHAGGKAVIDEVEKKLQLSTTDMEASRMTLHRFGNISSSSIWYEMAYIESKGRVLKGDCVWQIALGSGFKCNSAVWVALKDVKPSPNSPWED